VPSLLFVVEPTEPRVVDTATMPPDEVSVLP
jgi:hypothetical protein